MHHELHAGKAALHLADARYGADGVEALGGDFLGLGALGDGEDQLVGTAHRRLDGAQRRRAAGADRRGHAGKQNVLAKREHGKAQQDFGGRRLRIGHREFLRAAGKIGG
jgi:hypothetical protein